MLDFYDEKSKVKEIMHNYSSNSEKKRCNRLSPNSENRLLVINIFIKLIHNCIVRSADFTIR